MGQFNPHTYMDPNAGYRYYNGEYYLYTPTKTADYDGFSAGLGGTVQKLTPEEVTANRLNQNNTFRATIDPTTWVNNGKWTTEDFKSGIQNAFGGFDPSNTTGWQNQLDSLAQQASSAYNADPTKGTKIFGDVFNTFRNNNLPAIAQVQAKNNPARPEFTSQTQAGVYGATNQLMTPDQIQQMNRGGQSQPQSQPQAQYTGPTTTRLNPVTGLLEKVPVSTGVADQLPISISPTINPNELTNTTSLAGLFPQMGSTASAQMIGSIGNLGMSALDQALFQFQAQQQELAAGQRTQAETALAQAQQGLADVYNTSREGEIARILQETGIKEKQAALSDLKTKMAQAQEALGLGMQQENGRIAPMSIIGRRQQLLVEQAQGKIGALAAIANVYADDLDQAWAVANLTIDSMNQDRQEKIDAYQFLITANESKIVNLKAEEKEAINSQIGILKEAQAKAEANKDKVMQLIMGNTMEAQSAGISLTDSYEEAVKKITPFLAKREQKKFELEVLKLEQELMAKAPELATWGGMVHQWNPDLGPDGGWETVGSEDAPTDPNNTEAMDWANLIAGGQTKLSEVPSEIRSQVASALNSLPPKKEDIEGVQKKMNELKKIFYGDGYELDKAVGANWLARINFDALSLNDKAQKNRLIATIDQLVGQQALDKLIEAKANGATFGALSDGELNLLKASASKFGTWARDKDGDGKTDFYEIDEKSFKEEINNVYKEYQTLIRKANDRNAPAKQPQEIITDFYNKNPDKRNYIDSLDAAKNPDTGRPYTEEEKMQIYRNMGINFSQPLSMGGNGSQIGTLSKQFESRGDPGIIGWDSTGGTSYGTYQLAHGSAQTFVNQSPFKKDFSGLAYNSQGWQNKWKEVAKKDPRGFEQAQHDYIIKTHYTPQANKLAKAGIDLAQYSSVLQDVIFSTAVQHGANNDVIEKVFKKLGNSANEEDIIKAIYKERWNGGKRFASSTNAVKNSVYNRFFGKDGELNKALSMLG